jgi:hypothetical protein
MNRNLITILKLIKSGLLSEKCELDGDIDWNYIYHVCYRQRITCIVYQAIKDNNIKVPSEYLRLFQVQTLKDVKNDRDQIRFLDRLFNLFEEKEIAFIPLKGSFIKYIYPRTEFRQMADADIYIDIDKYDQIKQLMEQLGFTNSGNNDYHFGWQKDEMMIEFHKAFIGSYYGMTDTFEACAKKALSSNRSGSRSDLDISDHLLYSVAHLAKHCILGSINMLNLTDIYFLRGINDSDNQYLKNSLAETGLTRFYEVVCNALDEWFSGSAFSEETESLFNRILAVSKEATEKKNYSASVFKASAGRHKMTVRHKVKYYFRVAFPPYKRMAGHYNVLFKVPLLLPVFYLWRPFDKLFRSPESIRRFMKMNVRDSEKTIYQYKGEMNRLGLETIVSNIVNNYENKSR